MRAVEGDGSDSSDGADGDADAAEDGTTDATKRGWWVELPAGLRQMRPQEVVDGTARARLGALWRNYAKAYIANADIEVRYIPMNSTLAQQRASVLAEPTISSKETPIGVLKNVTLQRRRTEEGYLRAIHPVRGNKVRARGIMCGYPIWPPEFPRASRPLGDDR